MKPGDIIEHFQGTFAKVIAVGEGGLTWLSAWVRTPELAENETVAVTWLNDYGLNQVMKGGLYVEGEAEGTDDAEKPLSKLTVDELKAIATEMGLLAEGKKADLIAAIEAKRAEGTDDAE